MDVHKRTLNARVEAWDFPLVGSSFRAEDGSYRQTTLRQAFKKQEDLEPILVDLERYEYDGAPAYRVYFDEREVGNVPKDVAAELAQMEANGYTAFGDDCEIYGGPERDFPSKKFGARVYVRLRRKLTPAEQQEELHRLAHQAARPASSHGGPGLSQSSEARFEGPYEPEFPENRPSKKPKSKTALAVVCVILAIILVPRIVNSIIGALDFKNSPAEMQASAQAASERLDSAPAQESAPAPVEETFTPPDPIIYTGYGDDYFDISPFDSLYYFRITGNSGAHHFAVTGYDASGNYTDLFVNTTESYTGYVLDPEQNTRMLEVDAEGPWTVEIRSLYTAPVLSVGESYGGVDDAVLLLPSGCRSAVIEGNSKSRHFAVITYGSGYDLLVNTTDPYSGTVRVDSGATVMTVTAVGCWSVLVQ